MANDVTLFKGGVPAHLRSQPLNEITKSLLGGGKTTKRISIRGNMFRMIVNGKEVATSEDRAMNVVVVNVAPKVHRTFYAKAFDPTKSESPSCWSADGDRPDPKAEEPQSDTCVNCPKNVVGSGSNGKGKACRFGRLLAVVLENDLDGDVYQLSLPAQSIFGDAEDGKMPLNAYAQFLAGFNVNITAVVTEMRFDTKSATPKLFFKAVRPLDADEFEKIMGLGGKPEVKELVKVDFQAPTEEPAAPAAAGSPFKKSTESESKGDEVEESTEEVAPPTKRASKKSAEAPAPKKDLAAVLDQWDDEE